MTAEHFFAGLAIASFSTLALLIVRWSWPRRRPPVIHPTVPASRWPPYSEP
ncbi:hypothetical protein LQ772_06755 [Frateuria edaphi]|uniref:hypothetical protein n=1 Tax=Frateuria edaphi TaxID=2898793 RepID=UPI001E32F043|nr:hypothetical protein [Frateuria edaphi]UGB46985.1 hypothetical protein LQ772_06755 [Frateuria edaphi]